MTIWRSAGSSTAIFSIGKSSKLRPSRAVRFILIFGRSENSILSGFMKATRLIRIRKSLTGSNKARRVSQKVAPSFWQYHYFPLKYL